MTLDHLVNHTSRERQLRERAEQALRTGKITQAEHDFFLQKELGITRRSSAAETRHEVHTAYAKRKSHYEHRKDVAIKALTTFLGIALVLGVFWLLFGEGGLTGFVTFTPVSERTTPVTIILTESGTIPLETANTTAFKVTGTLTDGEADLLLVVGSERYVVAQLDATPPRYKVTTEKESYARDEAVTIIVTPAAPHTLWLLDEKGKKSAIQSPYLATTPGSYTIEALINDSGEIGRATVNFTVRHDKDPTKDVVRSTSVITAFTESCDETCDFGPTNGQPIALEVALTPGATLTITSITTTTPRENKAPVQMAELPAITLAVGETARVNLRNYFSDPDGDELTFDFMDVPGIEMSVADDKLILRGSEVGSQQSVVYASDLYELVQSNWYTITVTDAAATPENGTVQGNDETTTGRNETKPSPGTESTTTNETKNQTGNETGIPESLCGHPDPNKRPPDCLLQDAAKYFQPQQLYLTNAARTPVGRLTPVGNLILTGDVVQYAAFIPTPGDYTIGYEDEYGNFVATVWFDSSSGNLYLKGALHEESIETPGVSSYLLRNKRGVILAWADQESGDLYLRGNIITRERIERQDELRTN